jgi:elongation factor P
MKILPKKRGSCSKHRKLATAIKRARIMALLPFVTDNFMLSISEIKVGKLIQVNGEPFTVIKADHHKMGRGGAVLKVKLRNLINGNILEKTFQGNEKAEEASVEKKKANFLYQDEQNAHFMDNETFEQFELPTSQLGEKKKFMKDGTDVDTLYFEDRLR